jgi:hypothetical protein
LRDPGFRVAWVIVLSEKSKSGATETKFRLDANAVVVDFDRLTVLPNDGKPCRDSGTPALLAFQLRKISGKTTLQEEG